MRKLNKLLEEKMDISDFINNEYLDPEAFNSKYISAKPFPHIVIDDFISKQMLEHVYDEFPDLRNIPTKIEFKNQREIKFASEGFADLSPSAFKLISFLNSNVFLEYLSLLTGIEECLISDPYLAGGGYHEIKTGGLLKVHADFNKHPSIDMDRRLNLLLYLNKDWQDHWGGSLELFHEDDLSRPSVSIKPIFNRCVIFSTTSYTYHGHPTPLTLPENESRKSIALYYFSLGRPKSESHGKHGTLFVAAKGEKLSYDLRSILYDCIPPLLLRSAKRVYRKFI